ncbi:MAG: hypothetical protein AB1816_11420 [Bacillota bacterium]
MFRMGWILNWFIVLLPVVVLTQTGCLHNLVSVLTMVSDAFNQLNAALVLH